MCYVPIFQYAKVFEIIDNSKSIDEKQQFRLGAWTSRLHCAGETPALPVTV